MITALFVSSCTKDHEGTTNQGTIKQPEDNSEKVTGEFWCILSADMDTPGVYDESAVAHFVRSVQENAPIFADTVYINGLVTKKNLTDTFHYLFLADEAALSMRDSCRWEVADTTHPEIPSFKYNFRMPYPSVLGKISDTVTRATGFNMNIKVAEADSIVIAISGDTLNNNGFIVKTVSPAVNIYGFTSDEIKSIRPSSVSGVKQQFIIQAYKTTVQEFEGRYFRFTKHSIFSGKVWVKKE